MAFHSEDTSRLKITNKIFISHIIKPGVGLHTNGFGPSYGRLDSKLGHASLATAFRPSRLIFQPIPRENLESLVVRNHPITTMPFIMRF